MVVKLARTKKHEQAPSEFAWKEYDTVYHLLDDLSTKSITKTIGMSFIKAWPKLRKNIDGLGSYKNIMVSVSGGSDSDIVVDMIERIGHEPSQVTYVFYDTGMEFDATKHHLDFLEKKYGINILRRKAKIVVPNGVKKYGQPFISKRVSDYIHRLQNNGFKWEDKTFDVLYAEYPNCKVALKWWCNEWGNGSAANISRNKWLKEFMIENPPTFMISDGCCKGAKKQTARMVESEISPDLNVQGVRKGEGGTRATAYDSCFTEVVGGCDLFRPIYWFKKEDKESYEKTFDIKHSECYTKYGLKRTGCACCPFGRNFELELEMAKNYEPKLYKAAINVFGDSYEYTRKYVEYKEKMDAAEKGWMRK